MKQLAIKMVENQTLISTSCEAQICWAWMLEGKTWMQSKRKMAYRKSKVWKLSRSKSLRPAISRDLGHLDAFSKPLASKTKSKTWCFTRSRWLLPSTKVQVSSIFSSKCKTSAMARTRQGSGQQTFDLISLIIRVGQVAVASSNPQPFRRLIMPLVTTVGTTYLPAVLKYAKASTKWSHMTHQVLWMEWRTKV